MINLGAGKRTVAHIVILKLEFRVWCWNFGLLSVYSDPLSGNLVEEEIQDVQPFTTAILQKE